MHGFKSTILAEWKNCHVDDVQNRPSTEHPGISLSVKYRNDKIVKLVTVEPNFLHYLGMSARKNYM